MATYHLKTFFLGFIALIFLLTTSPGLLRADDDFDPLEDEFCTCWVNCCAFAEERILEDLPLPRSALEGNDDDDFEFPEMGVWSCVTCPFGNIFKLGDDDDDEPMNAGFNQMRPIGDRDGDHICDACDNCPDDPNGIDVVQDLETCEENNGGCRFQEAFLENASAEVVDPGFFCLIVDQADSNNDGVGDACTDEEPPAPPAAPPAGGGTEEDGGGQGTAVTCLTGGGPGGFSNGTCAGCSLTGSGTTPWQAVFGLMALGLAPWIIRRSWVRIRR